jgi:hypothetical protein
MRITYTLRAISAVSCLAALYLVSPEYEMTHFSPMLGGHDWEVGAFLFGNAAALGLALDNLQAFLDGHAP